MSGYLIAQLNMTDKESFKLYAETVPESVKKFGGKYLVRAGEFKSMQGKWDFTRNVIIEFPTYEKALEWYNSCLLYTSPSPRDMRRSRMPSSA